MKERGKLKKFYQKIKMSHGKITWNKALSLIGVFFRIGLFTFGGGYAMLPLIQKEIVEKKKWLSDIEILDVLIIAESTPGPVSINTATYVGYKVGGVVGALLSTLFLVIPSFVIIFIISLFFDDFIKIQWVKNAFSGIQAAVAVLIISAAEKLFKKMPKTATSCILFAVTTLIMLASKFFGFDLSTITIIILGFAISIGLCGMSLQREVREGKDIAIKVELRGENL